MKIVLTDRKEHNAGCILAQLRTVKRQLGAIKGQFTDKLINYTHFKYRTYVEINDFLFAFLTERIWIIENGNQRTLYSYIRFRFYSPLL